MSLKICTTEYMLSTQRGTDLAQAWLPYIPAERFATSSADGQVGQAPDPVPVIDTDLIWTNTSGAWQSLHLITHRAPRSIVSGNANTVVLSDAVSWDIGLSPNAPVPPVTTDGIAGRLKTTPTLLGSRFHWYARLFNDWDDWQTIDALGAIAAGETVQVRYQCVVTTPGEWRTGGNAMQEVNARWVRLQLLAAPLLEVI
ncbi:DUF7172 family protein [Nocardia sp. CA-290969]|uniref:DUF7172 family protein n=1 Tax=Nocardia sp. CA-290969 TaxID=3239986 RepID=UPI003D9195FC